jgi:uncharacterized YigZ family protein
VTGPEAHDISTIAAAVRVEIDKIKGSRFICDLAPAADERSAFGFVDRIRSEAPDATHHCWAFRLASGVARSSDDGEPGGTAGPPILRRLESGGLVDVVAVVTRYYGGTNLGTGGLIRAYGAATAAAIEVATIETRRRTVAYRFVHSYELSAQVNQVLAAHEVEVVGAEYGGTVALDVRVPEAMAPGFEAAITEATAGAVQAHRMTP